MNRSFMVRSILIAIGLVMTGVTFIPDLMGIGGPGLGLLQWMTLLIALTFFVVGVSLGRVRPQWLLALATTSCCLCVAIIVLHLGRTDLRYLTWNLQRQLAGPPQIGIYQTDHRLGWTHRPSTSGRDSHLDYDVVYRIDDRGMRLTERDRSEQLNCAILCLGGSFTFGHGVMDDQAYPALLARKLRGRCQVTNAAVNGWGTIQCYLRLQQMLAGSSEPPDLVLYGWISHHLQRNADRRSAIPHERKKPVVSLSDNGPVFEGLIGTEQGEPDSPQLRQREWQITLALIEAMDQLCQQNKSRFVCLVLPSDFAEDQSINQTLIGHLKDLNIRFIDLTNRDISRYPHDGHPTAEGQQVIAQEIMHAIEDSDWIQHNAPTPSIGTDEPSAPDSSR